MSTCCSHRGIEILSVDELSNVLSFLPQKQLIRSCIIINKSFQSAVFHGNAWCKTRLSSRQVFKCKDNEIFTKFASRSWSNLSKFSFMNYKAALSNKQKQILKTRLLCILRSSHNSLQSIQLHGFDISLFHTEDMKRLQNLQILWIVTPKRDQIISQRIWQNLVSSSRLVTLEIMSNFPLNVDDITQLRLAFEDSVDATHSHSVRNLKLSVGSSVQCNRQVCELIDVLSASLEVVFVTGMKHIENAQTGIIDALCKCDKLMVLSFMYRNAMDETDLYSHANCFELLHDLSFSLKRLKVLSLEYGPLVDYEWQDRYKAHISQYFPSLIWVKIGQNRIKNPFLSTPISHNVKVNRFCLSWNADP